MEKVESIKKEEEINIDEVAKKEKSKKEIISVGIECSRKNSRYPEGNRPHY